MKHKEKKEEKRKPKSISKEMKSALGTLLYVLKQANKK